MEKLTFEERLDENKGLCHRGVYLAEWMGVQRPWGRNVLCAFGEHQAGQGG